MRPAFWDCRAIANHRRKELRGKGLAYSPGEGWPTFTFWTGCFIQQVTRLQGFLAEWFAGANEMEQPGTVKHWLDE